MEVFSSSATEQPEESNLSVAQTVSHHISEVQDLLSKNITMENVLAVEGKSKVHFETAYSSFVQIVQDAEKYISDYLKVGKNCMLYYLNEGR